MEDWRLKGQEEYLSDVTLYKVQFPEFWRHAYETKNLFYQRIAADANHFVTQTGRGAEYLDGEKVQHFWHTHCAFCWEKAYTDKSCVFYCTEDMLHWVCEECFEDFQKKFQWQVKPVEDLFEYLNKS